MEAIRDVRLLLIRHAQSRPSADIPDEDWPLTALGEQQAEALVPLLRTFPICAVFSSPYRRAMATVRSFAKAAGLPIPVEPDLRERCLSPAWVEDWEVIADLIHDLHCRLPGGESAQEARERFEQALARIAGRYPGQTVAIATHGAVITHLMRHDHETLPADYHRRIANPHLFEIHWDASRIWLAETVLGDEPGVGWRSSAG
jgi:2,3-bisphosphoglycerate-dependent phosphoglycerate mutase